MDLLTYGTKYGRVDLLQKSYNFVKHILENLYTIRIFNPKLNLQNRNKIKSEGKSL
ncbi:hypothetical protein NMY3_00349 [Candidatus Nitrosocosmicus oleophilus]|uniref:Uncharacterized protein n=1 Tax=Candidatus Nitrosocosmicus oleophilus TaxID=1353260 RepID=A0A654LW62_9ARCH|nr:hypothetical protein NMY3_00349 [Candidatus Nitrosocosmicus oleophilus]